MNYRELVSRGDLHYEHTVKRSEGGLPIGNGRMGSLLWTSPSAVKLQVNRVDVYANDRSTNSFNQRHLDYAYACGFVDIDFVDNGEDAFQDGTVRQHLSLYDAMATIRGNGVGLEAFAYDHSDVFAFKVEDGRKNPQGINIKLKMLRPAEVATKNHTAVSKLVMHKDVMILKQEFREGSYYCSSAVAVGISGRGGVIRMNDELGGRAPVADFRVSKVLGQPNETEMRLCIRPETGNFEIFIASSATFDENEDVAASAIKQLEAARNAGYDRLLQEHQLWWNEFWQKSYIFLSSDDGSAEFVEKHYTYYVYLMASNSRSGKYPPNFGGMLLSPRGDFRHWGAMQWWSNLRLYYNAVQATGHYELMQPYFDMYSGMYDSCAKAAEQQWGSKGIYIPETVWFNGVDELPENIAAEMRELYLLRKPWEERSEIFKQYAHNKHPHESRWNWKGHEEWIDGSLVYSDKSWGPFGSTTHMFWNIVGIAYHYWNYYEFTKDLTWLNKRAYPMIKGAAEFLRNYPHLRKEDDGKYHLHNTISGEKYIGGKDTIQVMSALHGIFPVLLKASNVLDADQDMRPLWEEFYRNLAPLPRSDHPEAIYKTKEKEEPVWVGAIGRVLDDRQDIATDPMRDFILCSLETASENPDWFKTGKATLAYQRDRLGGDWGKAATEMSSVTVMLAGMGEAEGFKQAVLAQLECVNAEREYCYYADTGKIKYYDNRLTVREGVNAISAQRLGNVAHGLQLALCQSQPGAPGKEPVINVFPAVPDGWDAEFSLWCHGGFNVTSSIRNGVIVSLSIESTLGGICRLRNPWGERQVSVKNGDRESKIFSGSLLEFETLAGEAFNFIEMEVK
ncbi:glycosyl hydrolase family 95 catalytic domain-containing protein [Paenibacillus harenae]|uniref:glycosyl hydrolase family 95 catalytic domain-containing protein n=1 Tax=Paenibacillus harenae TaxID=306543 RepID=UPI0012EB0784|nr:glycoside hydrolase [Paenibacillus harenae]